MPGFAGEEYRKGLEFFPIINAIMLLEALFPGPEQLRNIAQNAYNDRPVTVCLSDVTPRPVTQQEASQ